ncbi:uncharacterized protein LOC114357750 [Ostrinia furnacalis]|uniref:uncharacterized protein LOC114357750 n=1 Tax=Ostrinia furnacalis TaxID=93504 RepID=UPI0010397954|nr:uncharacterized protein LOC114357750 [Ostrinia furnacalis]
MMSPVSPARARLVPPEQQARCSQAVELLQQRACSERDSCAVDALTAKRESCTRPSSRYDEPRESCTRPPGAARAAGALLPGRGAAAAARLLRARLLRRGRAHRQT